MACGTLPEDPLKEGSAKSDLNFLTRPAIDLRTAGRVGEPCAFRKLRLDLYSCRRNSRLVTRRRPGANGAVNDPELPPIRPPSPAYSLQSISTIGDVGEVDDDEEKQYADLHPSQLCYLNVCKRLHVIPSHKFLHALKGDRVDLRGYDLGANGSYAVAAALTKNATVRTLELNSNNMGDEGAQAMASMLEENIFITDLRIVENSIGEEGLQSLVEQLLDNDYITTLDLSGNRLEEGSAKHIASLLKRNTTIETLLLAHNNFREKGAIEIAYGIAANETVKDLDLSWNHIRRDGAIAICDCLGVNETLRVLNLSWNGLNMQGCLSLARVLALNSALQELDLTCNRMDSRALEQLLKGLKKNSSLLILKIGKNPITSDGIRDFLRSLDACKESRIEELFVTGMTVDKQTIDLAKRMAQKRAFRLNFGIILKQDQKENEEDETLNDDPMIVLMEFTKLRNMRLVDLFLGLDTDGSRSLSHKEFRDGLLAIGVPMSPLAVDRLIRRLDRDGDGEVDYAELIAGQRDYRRRMKKLAVEEKYLPYEETEVGKVNKKLRLLLAKKNNEGKKAAVARRMRSPNLSLSSASSLAFPFPSEERK